MSNYTENFSSVNGDTTDASELESEFDAIATAVNSKLDADGSGTMAGNLNMGNNSITNVSDPSNAQDAATKNYVDTMFVSDYDFPTASVISTSEAVESTVTVTIPSDWATYDIELLATYTTDAVGGSATTQTQINYIWRQTALGGTTVGSSTDIVQGAEPSATTNGACMGFLLAQSTTGSISFVFTSQASTNSGLFQVQELRARLLARRTS